MITGFDAVISAFGAYTPDTLPLHSKSIELFLISLLLEHRHVFYLGGAEEVYLDETQKRHDF